jgi:8-oxo-dGTP pyrophosphatase MutT (NUDIX family)
MSNKNRPIEVDGKIEWISRSIVISCVVLAKDKQGNNYVLLNQRGEAVNLTNLWNIPGGYLDYNETVDECAVREVFEETGVKIDLNKYKLSLIGIYSDPRGKKQNVLIIYGVVIDEFIEDIELTDKYSEPNEVKDIKFIKLDELDKFEGELLYNQPEFINRFKIMLKNAGKI